MKKYVNPCSMKWPMSPGATPYEEPKLIHGGMSVDQRGYVGYCNDFQFAGIQRFYTVENFYTQQVRAWHGHRQEHKYVLCTQGAALVAAVPIDDWEHPDKDSAVWTKVLTGMMGDIYHIPPGHANGFMSLEPDTHLIFFSTSTLEESSQDDIRYTWDYWNPWEVPQS